MTVVVPEAPDTQIFERGDKIYMTTKVAVFEPTDAQIEEFAFAKTLKKTAPNENIVWMRGQYVEADNANLNGAMWRSDELAIKSLTPVLMPVTVMHDPRTAVGTIAEAKLLTPDKDNVKRARIDTILALWGHRFPEAVAEAVGNAKAGTLMQSMECFSPWYECSECGASFQKLPGSVERANWCAHLKAADHPDDTMKASAGQSANASRILGDVCFTGTGLIYGSRGVKGAYTEAHLEHFQEELAAFHESAHQQTSVPIVTTASGGTSKMGLVQIEQSELDTLRTERDTARANEQKAVTEKSDVERQLAEAETAKQEAETEKTAAEAKATKLEEEKAQAALKDTRLAALGSGFTEKLGETTKARLATKAASVKDEDWEAELAMLEEVAKVKRDAKKDGDDAGNDGTGTAAGAGEKKDDPPAFGSEEVAAFVAGEGSQTPPTTPTTTSTLKRSQVIGGLADAFAPKK